MNDAELIGQFVEHGDQAAFAELVSRHMAWVYPMALRLSRGDYSAADEISQAVFILFAQRAESLVCKAHLSNWLFSAAKYVHLAAVRSEARRRRHQHRAAVQRSEIVQASEPATWELIAPLLDEVVGKLGKADRRIVLMRFYEQKTHSEIGQRLSISEDAARKRVQRALKQLREMLEQRGVTIGGAAFGSALLANVSYPLPAAAVEAVCKAALSPELQSVQTAALARRYAALLSRHALMYRIVAVLLLLGVLTPIFFVQRPSGPDAPAAPASTKQLQTAAGTISGGGGAAQRSGRTNVVTVPRTMLLNSPLPTARPGLPIQFDFRNSPVARPVGRQMRPTMISFNVQNSRGFQRLILRLPNGTELAMESTTTTQLLFNWYDPSLHSTSQFQNPNAELPAVLRDEIQDGQLDATVWVDGTGTGSGWARISVTLEADVSEPDPKPTN